MRTQHLEFLVEEPSMEACLQGLLPRLLGTGVSFSIHPSQSKAELLKRLPNKLKGYASWITPTCRIVVIIDRDTDDCKHLKQRLEGIAAQTGFATRSRDRVAWRIVNRIAIEELEAWFFGDMDAVRAAYPRVPPNVERASRFRDPDAIKGGTWEALERLLQRAGYFGGGLPKIQVARDIGQRLDPNRNRSQSFRVFRDAILEAADP